MPFMRRPMQKQNRVEYCNFHSCSANKGTNRTHEMIPCRWNGNGARERHVKCHGNEAEQIQSRKATSQTQPVHS